MEMSSRPAIPLIITGDDFGSSGAANRAIVEAHREGVLTAASLMVNEPAAEEAVGLALRHPRLAVGLHLVLALGRAALPPAEIAHITDARGAFAESPLRAGVNYFFSPAARREMRREMRAQFERFAATGLPFSHVDGHTHLHMHPTVFAELLRLAEEFGVRRVRVVRGELRASVGADRRRLPSKLLWGTVFNLLGGYCAARLRGRGLEAPRRVYGLLQSGGLDEDCLLALLPRMGGASSEIYAHPLAPDAGPEARRGNPGGASELRALTSPRVRAAIEARGFRLTS
ncbi:MAG TPA: hopanoid biosynthesis-associated protein HpnK [Blastocatellia bacterium]|jgi:chitin disaccharide deacetylase|nr:hopanoid biosynthesis-associated protein HpnK [Blastocatellia bacterium]